MKQELVTNFTLETLFSVEALLDENPELEITLLAFNRIGYTQALACYDWCRTMDTLDRLKVVVCGESINLATLVALAGFEKENRIAMSAVRYKQVRMTTAGYGNQADMVSSRESFGQIKSAVNGIMMTEYGVDAAYIETDTTVNLLAAETEFFTPYIVSNSTALPIDMKSVNDSDVDSTVEEIF